MTIKQKPILDQPFSSHENAFCTANIDFHINLKPILAAGQVSLHVIKVVFRVFFLIIFHDHCLLKLSSSFLIENQHHFSMFRKCSGYKTVLQLVMVDNSAHNSKEILCWLGEGLLEYITWLYGYVCRTW